MNRIAVSVVILLGLAGCGGSSSAPAPAEKGAVAGKVYLCLPDAEKSYLAGTFTAAVGRGLTDPPRPDDVPYITGTVTHRGERDQLLMVGYAGVTTDGKVVSEGVGN